MGGSVQPSTFQPSTNPQTFPQVQQPQMPMLPTSPQLTTANSNCIEADAQTCEIEMHIFQLTNQLRSSGATSVSFISFIFPKIYPPKPAFIYDGKIAWLARYWSMAQGTRKTLSHEGFENGQHDVIYRNKFGSTPRIVAENVAMFNFGPSMMNPQEIAQQLFAQWRSSDGHLKSMMGSFQTIGIGVYKTPGGSYYATQIFGD